MKWPNFDLIHLEADLSVLKQHLDFVEEQVRFQSEKSEFELDARLAVENYDLSNPRDSAYQRYHIEAHQLWVREELPRLVVNPFIVALWALFESVITDLASLIQKKQGKALSLNDIKGDNFLKRVDKYYRYVLQFPLDLNSDNEARLNFLGAIRNAIAHSNGRLSSLSKANQKAIQENDIQGVSRSSWDYLVLEVEFACSSFELVEELLRNLFNKYNAL